MVILLSGESVAKSSPQGLAQAWPSPIIHTSTGLTLLV